MFTRLSLILLLLSSNLYADNGPFLYGQLGVGAYNRNMGDPEITTPNMLGDVQLGGGYTFDHNVDIKLGIEHWSSMQGFPAVFDSPDEDGRGFNAIWLKLEKRFYLK